MPFLRNFSLKRVGRVCPIPSEDRIHSGKRVGVIFFSLSSKNL